MRTEIDTFYRANTRNQFSYDAEKQSNNFDLLRFVFAFIVFLVHAYALSGSEALFILNKVFSSEIAVKSFFVVSGFLIFMSYENSGEISRFFIKRVRRIYPAYFFVILVCGVVGSVFSIYSWNEYWSLGVLNYFAANIIFLNFIQPNLPGLFENNTLQAVNGALWTLKIEVMFYFFVPFAVMAFRKFGQLQMLAIFYVASVLYSLIMFELARRTGMHSYIELQRQLPGQLVFFIAGAIGYYYFHYMAKYSLLLLMSVVAAFVFKAWLPWLVIEPIVLGFLVIYFACIFPYIGNFGKYGDFSYGIYIVHFPLLQLLVALGWFNNSPWIALSITGLLLLIGAVLLWNFIEKPFLRKSSHYVAINNR